MEIKLPFSFWRVFGGLFILILAANMIGLVTPAALVWLGWIGVVAGIALLVGF